MDFINRLKKGWNAFSNKDPTPSQNWSSMSYSRRPDRVRFSRGNERSIVTNLYNRLAMDAASIAIKHVKLDENMRYVEDVKSGLNNCLNLEANIDQTGKAFLHDVFASLLDEGSVALVPIDTNITPNETGTFDIETIRTGKILEWRPAHVKVQVYNDTNGKRAEVWMHKKNVGILENPWYAVMNEPNSTVQRLIRKLNLLDAIDEQSGSGKLDLIIQLPYVVKTEAKRQQAEKRRMDIENQLSGSKFGIAYTDGTERVTQLNRPVENNLMKQIEYLTNTMYGQIGMTQSILDGTADEQTLLNYFSKIEYLVSILCDELNRKFLSKTARTQRQAFTYFRNPFGLVPINNLAEIADKFTRNEILTSNEIRQIIGMKPSSDPKADQLVNSNISQPEENSDYEDYSEDEYEEYE